LAAAKDQFIVDPRRGHLSQKNSPFYRFYRVRAKLVEHTMQNTITNHSHLSIQNVVLFLRSQDFKQLPQELCQGKTRSSHRCSVSFIHPTTKQFHSFDSGEDPNSCSTTAVGILHCIATGFDTLRNLRDIQNFYEQTLDHLPSNVDEINHQTYCVYFFHTPGHRFVLLCMKDEGGIILQSNKDGYTNGRNCGRVFDFRTYSQEPNEMIRFPKPHHILQFFQDLIRARDDKDQCESIFDLHFGYRFSWTSPFIPFTTPRRSSGEWWFCKVPISSTFHPIPTRKDVVECH